MADVRCPMCRSTFPPEPRADGRVECPRCYEVFDPAAPTRAASPKPVVEPAIPVAEAVEDDIPVIQPVAPTAKPNRPVAVVVSPAPPPATLVEPPPKPPVRKTVGTPAAKPKRRTARRDEPPEEPDGSRGRVFALGVLGLLVIVASGVGAAYRAKAEKPKPRAAAAVTSAVSG